MSNISTRESRGEESLGLWKIDQEKDVNVTGIGGKR